MSILMKEPLGNTAHRESIIKMLLALPLHERIEVAAKILLRDAEEDQPRRSIRIGEDNDAGCVLNIKMARGAADTLREILEEIQRIPATAAAEIEISLSKRQAQVLRLLLWGVSEKQIAYGLEISRHTVHEHVKALYRGFHVNSRAELMSRMLREVTQFTACNRKHVVSTALNLS